MMPIFISSVIDNTVKIIDKTRTGGVMAEDSWQMTALTIIFYMLMIAGALLALTVLLWAVCMFAMFCIWVKNRIITAQDKKRKEMEEDDGYRHEFREYREHQRRNLK